MKSWLILAVLVLVSGCGGDSTAPSSKAPSDDPIIEVREDVGGGVGPVGGGRGRYYKGPASKAPSWTKK